MHVQTIIEILSFSPLRDRPRIPGWVQVTLYSIPDVLQSWHPRLTTTLILVQSPFLIAQHSDRRNQALSLILYIFFLFVVTSNPTPLRYLLGTSGWFFYSVSFKLSEWWNSDEVRMAQICEKSNLCNHSPWAQHAPTQMAASCVLVLQDSLETD